MHFFQKIRASFTKKSFLSKIFLVYYSSSLTDPGVNVFLPHCKEFHLLHTVIPLIFLFILSCCKKEQAKDAKATAWRYDINDQRECNAYVFARIIQDSTSNITRCCRSKVESSNIVITCTLLPFLIINLKISSCGFVDDDDDDDDGYDCYKLFCLWRKIHRKKRETTSTITPNHTFDFAIKK